MDSVKDGIDADESSVDGRLKGDDNSQPTFNVLVRGTEKYEELDAFLSQGDPRNTPEFGYDYFHSDKTLADDPHILESTLDSILGVNEEEEVVGQVDDDEQLERGFHKSNDEVDIKDAKKYNTRQRRRPYNDEMFVYESPSSAAVNKREKIKKKQEPSRGRGRGRSKVSLGNADDDGSPAVNKTENEAASANKSKFEDRRMTRRQSLLTGIKPVSNSNAASGKDNKSDDDRSSMRTSSVCADDDGGDDDDEEEMNSDAISNASQEKHKETNEAKIKLEEIENVTIKQEVESCDYSIACNEKPDEMVSHRDDSQNISIKSSPDVKTIATRNVRKRGRPPKKHVEKQIESSDTTSDMDLKQKPTEQNESDASAKFQPGCKASQFNTNLFEIITSAVETHTAKSESQTAETKTIDDGPAECGTKERKSVPVVEKKVETISVRNADIEKVQEQPNQMARDGGSEIQKTKTISLESFVQNSIRKGRKSCRGPGCEAPINPAQKSIYCSQSCTEKYSHYVLQVLAKERTKMGQPSGIRSNDRLVVLERQTGKVLTGPAAPTEATLAAWLIRHPSFEVMLSSQPKLDERKEKKMPSEKKPLPAHLRDNPALTKDIRDMAAKLLGPKKEVDDVNKTSSGEGISNQLKRPDPIRMSVRNALREALSSRANDCDDVMVSTNEIKSLAMDIEDELCKVCEGVTPKYKYKVRAIVTQIKDTSNKGFFRRLLFGELQPNQLVRMTNEKITSKELSEWNKDNSALSILGNDATFQPSFDNKPKSPPYQPIFDIALSATSETTAQHGTHFFDMNCKICTGKVPEPSYNPVPKTEGNFGYYSKNINETSPIPSYPLSPKPPLKMPLLPTPVPQHNFLNSTSNSSSSSVAHSKVTSPCDGDDAVWTGTIYAREITSVRINSYLVSGSLSSPTAGSIKSIMQEDLRDTIHMAGRVLPDNVFNFITQLRSTGRLFKEVAVVYFLPTSSSENSFYQSLFAYLNSRSRFGLISPGIKREVGRIKDFYLVPLPANASPPAALLPLEGQGLPTTRGDLILGIITKYAPKPEVVADKVVQMSSPNIQILESNKSMIQESPPVEMVGDSFDDEDDNDSERDNRVIFNSNQVSSFKSDDPKSSTTKAKTSVKPLLESPLIAEDEPYEPFEGPTSSKISSAVFTSKQTTSQTSVKKIPDKANDARRMSSRVKVIAPSNVNMSILASENIAATMLSTLSAVTNSTSLQEQQKMLLDLTQKINEQKIILQHQEKSIKRIPDTPPPNSPMTSIQPDLHDVSSSHVSTQAAKTFVTTPHSSHNLKEKYHLTDRETVFDMKTSAPTKAVSQDNKNPTSSQSNLPGAAMASLPASINQFLSGETFKNLKNIMANMSTSSKQTCLQQTEISSSVQKIDSDKSCQYLMDSKLPFNTPKNLGSPLVASNDSIEDSYKNVRDPIINTNFHGDIDYRFEPKPSHEKTTVEQQIFIPSPPLSGNAVSDQFKIGQNAPTIPTVPAVRKPLLATPPQSPFPIASQSKSSEDVRSEISRQSSEIDLHVSASKKDSMVWKPLLPSGEASHNNKSRGSASTKSDSPSVRKRDDWAEGGRPRDRKRKRSPAVNSSHEYKKNDRDVFKNKSCLEIKDDSDDVQIIKHDSETVDVIEIDEEEEMPENDKARSRKTEQRAGSAERTTRRRSRERSTSRSRRMRRMRRSRSPRNKHQNKAIRRSRSRSPARRQAPSKIDPSNLPHNLSSLFPSLMQIVGGSNAPRKSDNESSSTAPKSGIPSLLDMLDPKLLPDRYKKIENYGLLGNYTEIENFNSAPGNVKEAKPLKKGLLGDFPSQLNTGKDLEDSIDINLSALRRESGNSTGYEKRGNNYESSNINSNISSHGYKRQPESYNSRTTFDKKDATPDSDEVPARKQDETLMLPPPPPPPWTLRSDMPPMTSPPFPPPSYFMPGGGMHIPLMPFPRGTDSRAFMRFPPQPMLAPPGRPRGYFSGGQRPLRSPLRPPRPPKH